MKLGTADTIWPKSLMPFLLAFAAYLLASFSITVLIGRWLRRPSAQEEADSDEDANCLRLLLKLHPEILRGR